MASDRPTLNVAERTDFGSRTARRLRREGLVPGVVYAGGSTLAHSLCPEREVNHVIEHGGSAHRRRLRGRWHHAGRGQGAAAPPGPRRPVHLDLIEVKLDEEIEADVTIELLGIEEAPGVKEGGVLEHVTREITIRALPTAIPESIAVDVSGMEINDTLQLSAVTPPEGVEFALAEDAEELTIATLSPPRVEEEPEPELEEEAELVGEEGEEPAAEGEGEDAEAPAAEGGDSGEE